MFLAHVFTSGNIVHNLAMVKWYSEFVSEHVDEFDE